MTKPVLMTYHGLMTEHNTDSAVMEYRMWLLHQSWSAEDIEVELNRLSRDHGWRCTGFVPMNTFQNSRIGGYFLLERPAKNAS